METILPADLNNKKYKNESLFRKSNKSFIIILIPCEEKAFMTKGRINFNMTPRPKCTTF